MLWWNQRCTTPLGVDTRQVDDNKLNSISVDNNLTFQPGEYI